MAPTDHSNGSKRFPILSRREIEGMIAAGKSIIIKEQKVLRVDAWLPYHPGGFKPIQHMIGRDATDEIIGMHSEATCKQMDRYQIGWIEGRWRNFTPPIQGGQFRHLAEGDTSADGDQAADDEKIAQQAERPDVYERRMADDAVLSSTAAKVGGPGFLDTQTNEELLLLSQTYPAVDYQTQDDIIEKYRRLYDQILAEGLYECNYTAYAWEMARYSLLFGLFLSFLRAGWYGTSGACLGMFWSQLVFAAHDAGHMGITHNYTIDTLIAMTIAAPIGGLSMGWWKRTHNVHHLVTNSPEHDPDNQHLPFFAVSHYFLGNIFSTYHNRLLPYDAVAQFLVPFQAYLYYPVLAFGRFNLYAQSYIFLAEGQGPRKGIAWWHRWYEIAGVVVFWFWFGYLLVYKTIPTAGGRIMFVLVSHMVTALLHVQITLSHFAMSTADLGASESFPQKMLRTTMDVDCPEWLDWFHGGLQFQAIHHLFPRIPRHNLRRAQKMVQKFCDEVHIPYALYGFAHGNAKVLGSLAEVSRQAAILAQCQQAIAQRGDIFHDVVSN